MRGKESGREGKDRIGGEKGGVRRRQVGAEWEGRKGNMEGGKKKEAVK